MPVPYMVSDKPRHSAGAQAAVPDPIPAYLTTPWWAALWCSPSVPGTLLSENSSRHQQPPCRLFLRTGMNCTLAAFEKGWKGETL